MVELAPAVASSGNKNWSLTGFYISVKVRKTLYMEKYIIIGSANEVEAAATRKALIKLDLLYYYKVVPCITPWSSSVVLMDDIEAFKVAQNMVLYCKKHHKNGEFYIAISPYVRYDTAVNRYFFSSYILILGNDGRESVSRTAECEVDGAVLRDVKGQIDLHRAVESVYNTKSTEKGTGYSGIASCNVVTQIKLYTQALVFVLAKVIKQNASL